MIVEPFAGAGGWSTGLRMAGYTGPAFGVEFDRAACLTATAAGHWRVQADAATFPLSRLRGQVEGLTASPPCQSYSSAGKRGGEADRPLVHERLAAFAADVTPPARSWVDDRSRLTAEPMRWVAALRPRWVALEQVPPVLPLWQHMAALLRSRGYSTWCGILASERYGVPQTRRRAILMASLDGPVSRPPATHQPYRSGVAPQVDDDLFGPPLPPPVSMAEALGWDGVDRPARTVCGARSPRWQYGPGNSSYDTGWMVGGGSGIGGVNHWVLRSNYGTGGDPNDRGERGADEPAATVTGKAGRNLWMLRNGSQDNACERGLDEPAGTIFFGRRLNDVAWVQDRLATSVCGDTCIAPPGHRDREGGERQFGDGTVRVSVADAGVLQSFPRDHPWRGTRTQQYGQVGNAVPPLLAMHILRPLLAASAQQGAA